MMSDILGFGKMSWEWVMWIRLCVNVVITWADGLNTEGEGGQTDPVFGLRDLVRYMTNNRNTQTVPFSNCTVGT